MFDFYILPGNPPPNFDYRDVYNKGYVHYSATWKKIFNRPNRPKLYEPMGYYRQNYVFQVQDGDNVVAQTLATHYHLDNVITNDLPFFEKFQGEPTHYLKLHGAKSCLSLEYSSVNRNYSPRKLGGLNMYKVIFQLSVRYARLLSVSAIIGHPRRLTRTTDITSEIGCVPIKTGLSKYGVSVDVSIGLLGQVRNFDDLEVARVESELWKRRTDTLGISTNSKTTPKNKYLNENSGKMGVAS